MDVQQIATLVSACGGGALLLALVTGLKDWLSGAAGRERDRNTDLITQRRDAVEEKQTAMKEKREAEKERDEADEKRREAEEHVGMLKNQIRELGHVPIEREKEE